MLRQTGKIIRQTGKIMTKSSVITYRLSITMAGLIIGYVFSSDQPALISIRIKLLKHRPRWLSWMRRPTGDQEVANSAPPGAEVGNIFSWRLIMKYFLRSLSPFS